MWDSTMTVMMLEGIRDTVYMTVVSTLFGYILGLPLGIALTLTDKNGLRQNRTIYRTLDMIINITSKLTLLTNYNERFTMNQTLSLVLGIAIYALIIYQTFTLMIKRKKAKETASK